MSVLMNHDNGWHKKYKLLRKNHLSKKFKELLDGFFLFAMSSSFVLFVAFGILVGFKFGETVFGCSFDFLAKTLG